MTTALALRPPPPPKDTRADEPDSFGKKDVRLSEKALELRRRVEKRRQEAQDKFTREAELVLQRQQTRQKRHVIAQQEVHGSERLVDADLLLITTNSSRGPATSLIWERSTNDSEETRNGPYERHAKTKTN